MHLGDVGYISWSYGSDPKKWSAWDPKAYSGVLMVLDSPNLWRKEVYPEYKIRRAEQREEDPEKLARKVRVESFKAALIEDPRLRKVGIEGLEADDVIALLCWKCPGVKITGVDKDLLQLAGYYSLMRRIGGEIVDIDHILAKIPETVKHIGFTPMMIPVMLSIMGDKSDSIPRLVPPRELKTYELIMESDSPAATAFEIFGYEFLRNLWLTLLPYPGIFGISDQEAFHLYCSGGWTPSNLLPLLSPEMTETINEACVWLRSTKTSIKKGVTEIVLGDEW